MILQKAIMMKPLMMEMVGIKWTNNNNTSPHVRQTPARHQQAPLVWQMAHRTAPCDSPFTILKATSGGVLNDTVKCTDILKQMCRVLMHIHAKGFLQMIWKQIMGSPTRQRTTLLSLTSGKAANKAKVWKPSLDNDKEIRKCPHIALEIHHGAKQWTSNSLFSFGVFIVCLFRGKVRYSLSS